MHVRSFRLSRIANPPEPGLGGASLLIAASGISVMLLVLTGYLLGISLSPLTWYLVRASGLTLYLLLWFSVVCGLGLTTHVLDRVAGGRGNVYSLHGYATQLSYGFLALHISTLVADNYVAFGLRDVLVPFTSGLSEPWTGLGVLAAELTIVLGVSFAVRTALSYRGWRALHWLAFPIYIMALAHGLGSGTDSSHLWARVFYALTAAIVLWGTVVRARAGRRQGKLDLAPSEPILDRMTMRSTTPPPSRGLRRVLAAVHR